MGTIEAVLGADRVPGSAGQREAVYRVRFASEELYGPGSEPPHAVLADLWESYLEAAP